MGLGFQYDLMTVAYFLLGHPVNVLLLMPTYIVLGFFFYTDFERKNLYSLTSFKKIFWKTWVLYFLNLCDFWTG